MPAETFKACKTRWYILTVFSMGSFSQMLMHNTWGPISTLAEKAFDFSQTDLAVLPNWFNIGCFLASFPFIWLVHEKGLCSSMLLTASLCAVGATFRCIPSPSPQIDRVLIHIGQALNGLAAPGAWFVCTEISETWFPPRERLLATSIGLAAGRLGRAVSFIGPSFVAAFQPKKREDTLEAIRFFLYFQYVLATFVLIMVLLYFPKKPPTPPSYTATVKRLPVLQGIRALARVRQAWILISVYAVSTAIYTSWHQIMVDFLSEAMTEQKIGLLRIFNIVLSIISGPALALTARFWIKKYSQPVCVTLIGIGCVSLLILTMASMVFRQVIFTPTTIWATLPLASLVISAPQAIWWELACEAAYPIAEGTVSGIASLGSCLGSSIFVFLYMFPSVFGTGWAVWALLFSEFLCMPALRLYKPTWKRTQADKTRGEIAMLKINDTK